jgi:hypothetical protein
MVKQWFGFLRFDLLTGFLLSIIHAYSFFFLASIICPKVSV